VQGSKLSYQLVPEQTQGDLSSSYAYTQHCYCREQHYYYPQTPKVFLCEKQGLFYVHIHIHIHIRIHVHNRI
jgi:hypothetical protein